MMIIIFCPCIIFNAHAHTYFYIKSNNTTGIMCILPTYVSILCLYLKKKKKKKKKKNRPTDPNFFGQAT